MLRAVARGYTNDQIAQRMGLSPKRVANLLTAIYAKLQLPNRVALALYYWGRSDLLAVNPEAPPRNRVQAGGSSRIDGNFLPCGRGGGDAILFFKNTGTG